MLADATSQLESSLEANTAGALLALPAPQKGASFNRKDSANKAIAKGKEARALVRRLAEERKQRELTQKLRYEEERVRIEEQSKGALERDKERQQQREEEKLKKRLEYQDK